MIGPAFADVLAAARTRAPWALELLYGDLAPAVTGYLRLHGADEPDDVTSETFIGVLTGLQSFSGGEAEFRSWVFTIAHRRLVDAWRRAGRRPQTTDDGVEVLAGRPGGDVEDDALAALGTERVRELCARLGPDQRAVLLLRILGDLTVEEVARALDKTPGAVKALQRRALRAVGLTLTEQSSPEGAPLDGPRAMTRTR